MKRKVNSGEVLNQKYNAGSVLMSYIVGKNVWRRMVSSEPSVLNAVNNGVHYGCANGRELSRMGVDPEVMETALLPADG